MHASPSSGRAFLPIPTPQAVSALSSDLASFLASRTPNMLITPATSPPRWLQPSPGVDVHATCQQQLFAVGAPSPPQSFMMPAHLQLMTLPTSTSAAVPQRKSPKRNGRCVSCLSAMKSAPYNWFSWNVSVYNAQSVRQHIGKASTERLHHHKMQEIEYYCEVQPIDHCVCLFLVLIRSISPHFFLTGGKRHKLCKNCSDNKLFNCHVEEMELRNHNLRSQPWEYVRSLCTRPSPTITEEATALYYHFINGRDEMLDFNARKCASQKPRKYK